MNWKQYRELTDPLKVEKRRIERQIAEYDEEYIRDNAEFPVGTRVVIKARTKTLKAVVTGYRIESGRCIPALRLVTSGTKRFYFRQHEYDTRIEVVKDESQEG